MKQQKKARKTFRLFLAGIFIFALIGYIGASVGGTFYLTTAPERQLPEINPASVGLPTYREVSFPGSEANAVTLNGWWIPRPDSAKVLILMHVKNGDRTFPLKIAYPLWEAGYNLLMFDMRGHGASGGEHYTYGYYEQNDIVGAVGWLKKQGFRPTHIGIIGWSMGGAAALLAMGQTPDIKAGVIDSAYGDLPRVTASRLGLLSVLTPGLNLSAKFFLNADFEAIRPEAAFQNFGNRRVILIHGENDQTVPVSEARYLQKAGGANIEETWLLPGVEHAGAYDVRPHEYLQKVLAFFEREL